MRPTREIFLRFIITTFVLWRIERVRERDRKRERKKKKNTPNACEGFHFHPSSQRQSDECSNAISTCLDFQTGLVRLSVTSTHPPPPPNSLGPRAIVFISAEVWSHFPNAIFTYASLAFTYRVTLHFVGRCELPRLLWRVSHARFTAEPYFKWRKTSHNFGNRKYVTMTSSYCRWITHWTWPSVCSLFSSLYEVMRYGRRSWNC